MGFLGIPESFLAPALHFGSEKLVRWIPLSAKKGVGWSLLGPSEVPLALLESKVNFQWISASFWVHFGSILNPFGAPFWLILDHWGLPGLSWGRLGSPWAPEGSQRRSWERRAGSLDPPWVPQSDPKMAAKIDVKTLENLYDFLGDF